MTLIERIRRRLRHRLRLLHLALTMPRIAGGAPDDPPAPPASGGDPPKDPPPPPKKEDDAPKSFSEDDVNRIVQERLARDRKERPTDDELKQLREAKAALDKISEENASDLEKAQKKAELAEKERDEAKALAQTTLVRSAVIAEAAKQNAVDPDAVVALLPEGAVKIGDDGNVEGAEDAVKALLDSKTYLAGEGKAGGDDPPPPGDGGARSPVPPKDIDDQIREAEKKGDTATSIRLKNIKLLALRDKQS